MRVLTMLTIHFKLSQYWFKYTNVHLGFYFNILFSFFQLIYKALFANIDEILKLIFQVWVLNAALS